MTNKYSNNVGYTMNSKPLQPLPSNIEARIRAFCRAGYKAYDQQDFKQAIRLFFQAWNLLPKPQSQWQAAGWVLTALGDAYYQYGNYNSALEALNSALHCPKNSRNPFVYMRIAQSWYGLKQLETAKKALLKTVELGGESLLKKENSRYLTLLKSNSLN